MIISRTPLRVSFVGGGSDLPSFYREHGGAVLSASISKYIYLSMHAHFDPETFLLKYSSIEKVHLVGDIQHRIVRQVFKDLGIAGVDFNSSADVPAGTGMGSSSAFTVGLLNLCHAYLGRYVSRQRLAELACEVEIDKLGEPIGKQDQYGCALGGLNFIEFVDDGTVRHEPIPLTPELRRQLEANLHLYYLGGTRSASAILVNQSKNSASDAEVVRNLKAMVRQAHDLKNEIRSNLDVLGDYLHEGWERKRTLAAGISSPAIDEAYALARAAGATGGKLLGAGGSGFLLLYVPSARTEAVRERMAAYRRFPFEIDGAGATIIYSDTH